MSSTEEIIEGNITHNDIMLTQHWHLPQALIGESVEIIWSVLPPRPALSPSSLDQFIYQTDRSGQRRDR